MPPDRGRSTHGKTWRPVYARGVAGPNILVVEDDETIGRSLEEALAAQGYRVTRVATAAAGGLAADQERGLPP